MPSLLPATKAGSPANRFPWPWLIATLGVVLARALPNLHFPIGRDQATYCLIGQGLLEGQQLYRDLWDNKPPGIFLVYAVIVKLFGPVMWSVGLADILLLLMVSSFLFLFAYRHLGAPGAALGTIIAAALHCSSDYVHATQPEGVLLVFVFGSYFLLKPEHPRWFLCCLAAGVILGAAFWVKYNAVAFFPWVALGPYLEFAPLDNPRRRLTLRIPVRDLGLRTCLLGTGFVGFSAALLAYFWLSGAWPAFREAQFEVLPRYGAMGFEHPGIGPWAVGDVYKRLGPWNEGIAAVALLVAWKKRELARVIPVAFAALSGLAVALLPGRLHSYYFETVFPFLALFWGFVGVKIYASFRLVRQFFARHAWSVARGLSWLVLANLVYALAFQEGVNVVRNYRSFANWLHDPRQSYADYFPQHPLEKLADQLRVIDFLKANSAANDKVYVWGTAPLINFLGQRSSPSRFVSNLALISPWGPDHWRMELVRELEARPPRFIVVARHDAIAPVSRTWRDSEQFLQVFLSLAALISDRYERAVNFRDFAVYRLR